MLAKKSLGAAPAAEALYVEDVFSTYLYTGTGSAQTITNNINLSTKGGLVWTKNRNGAQSNYLVDTVTGAQKELISNSTAAQANNSGGITSFSSSGYSIGTDGGYNGNADTYASWTFRKAEKFFDVVTYTGNGNTERSINHSLGSSPGFVIIKNTANASNWSVYHRSLSPNYLLLNSTAANSVANISPTDGATYAGWIRDVSSTTFSVTTEDPNTGLGTTGHNVNKNGDTYVAYLFAHDAGGFGDSGEENVISCGSYTGTGTTVDVTLGWEPQFIIVKRTDDVSPWTMWDIMRGLANNGTSDDKRLRPNTSEAEGNSPYGHPTATGFTVTGTNTDYNASGGTYIYIAIRRGPMKTPEAGTEVFMPVFASSSGPFTATAGFPVDAVFYKDKSTTADNYNRARLTGLNYLVPNSTAAEVSNSNGQFDSNTSVFAPLVSGDFSSYINWMFRRAPGFFDVVCYTGTGVARTVSHNLTVVPELIIGKNRTNAAKWSVYSAPVGNTAALSLNLSDAPETGSWYWNNTTPTNSVFTLGDSGINLSGDSFVAYLFASVPGVSKVGSYTGNGSSVTVTTGFQPRFILVKRTDSTGNWIVGDSARGLVASSDPYLLLNSTAAEDTDEDWVDVSSTGFTVNETSAANANVNTGTYIYLAIA